MSIHNAKWSQYANLLGQILYVTEFRISFFLQSNIDESY